MTSEPAETVTDVTCTVCGCTCDDLVLEVRGERFEAVSGPCSLAEPWFRELDAARPPACLVDDAEVSFDDAAQRAAETLMASRAPLVYGLSRSSTPGQRAAVRLADRLSATVDTTASVCHAPSILAIQHAGESTSTLGEVRHRADLVVFWGADPATSHPRHAERYSSDAVGRFVPEGRAGRTIVVVDVEETETARTADLFVKVTPGRDFEAVNWLRGRTTGALDESAPVPDGIDEVALRELQRLAVGCDFGAVFFGLGIAQSRLGHLTVETLLQWVAELHDHTRWVARRMRIPGDVSGADSVLCWQTGFPFAVDLSRGFPRYDPGEYSANGRLERGEVDACLLVGSESVPNLSDAARAHLASIPTIVLDHPHRPSTTPASVRFTTAVHGVHAPGTIYRMDEVPIPLRACVPTEYPTDEVVIERIEELLDPDRNSECD